MIRDGERTKIGIEKLTSKLGYRLLTYTTIGFTLNLKKY